MPNQGGGVAGRRPRVAISVNDLPAPTPNRSRTHVPAREPGITKLADVASAQLGRYRCAPVLLSCGTRMAARQRGHPTAQFGSQPNRPTERRTPPTFEPSLPDLRIQEDFGRFGDQGWPDSREC